MCMATERLIIGKVPALFTALHVLVFGSTLMVYNVHYIVKRSTPSLSDRFAWSQFHMLWHRVMFSIGFLGCFVSIFFVNWQILVGCAVLAFLSFAYSLPLLPFKDKRRIREFGWVKITVLTLVWTIVTSVLPMLYWEVPLTDYPLEIVIRFVFMFTLCVAFDIRDMQTDLESGIATLPNLIGVKNSYRLMDATLILFVLLCVLQYLHYPIPSRLAGEVVAALVTKYVIHYSRTHPSDRVYLGLIDGMMLLYGVLLLLN